jgi:DDE family transposase
LTSHLRSFESEPLTQADNLAGLAALNRELIARAETINSPRRIVLDMDSTEVQVCGEQEQSAYNGHFESTCYHPLLLFNGEGDCLAAKLRPQRRGLGGTATAGDQAPTAAGQGGSLSRRCGLCQAGGVRGRWKNGRRSYVVRLPANDNLERSIREPLKRPVGRPSYRPVARSKSSLNQAAS